MMVLVAVTVSAQMDMLPEIFRELPPELSSGLPDDMTYEHYRQMTRNVDFFTMFMSMWVPGYGFYQVERPGLAAGIMAERVLATGLMAAATIRQWSDIRDLGQLQQLSDVEYRSFLINAALFGSGIVLHGLGWALDVLGAYHIAKAENDYVLYRYGLVANVDGSNEERLRRYLRAAVIQEDDRLELSEELERYLRAFPDAEAAPEMVFHLGAIRARERDQTQAFAYLSRSLFAYGNHDYVEAAQQLLIGLVHRNRRAWAPDWDALWSMASTSVPGDEAPEERYYDFLLKLSEYRSEEFRKLFVQEARYYLWRFPGNPHEPRILYEMGRRAAELGLDAEAASSFASILHEYADSSFYYRAVEELGRLYGTTLREASRAARVYEFAERAMDDGIIRAEREARAESLLNRYRLLVDLERTDEANAVRQELERSHPGVSVE